MTRDIAVRLLVASAMALGLSGCAEMFPETYRFRLTVEVDTPQGLRSGSSVYEVWANNKTALLPEEAKRDWGVKGEAVAVDLPNGRTLFSLLKTNSDLGDLAGLSMSALDPAYRNDIVESAKRISAAQGTLQQAEVPPEEYPQLITFRNNRDPKSVEAVTPSNISARFGPGYAVRRITVAVTREDVTTEIEKRLSWIEGMESHDFRIDGPLYESYPIVLLGLRYK